MPPVTTTEQLRSLVRGHRVSEVAKISGVARTKIHDWLAGRVGLRIEEAERVAEACGKRLVLQD